MFVFLKSHLLEGFDAVQYLSGTLPFSHGFEASIPVQQLEHGHQLLEDKHRQAHE